MPAPILPQVAVPLALYVRTLVPGLAAEAPFHVLDLLMFDDRPLPTIAPQLPAEITDVWAATPGTTGTVYRWSATTGWLRFRKPPAVEP